MRFYEKLLFHILKNNGLGYDSDEDNECEDGEEEEITIDESIKQDPLFVVCDINDNKDTREFFRK